MSIGLINIILLLGAAQGILLVVLIFHKHRKLFANRFLGTMMLSFSIVLLNLLFYELGFYLQFPHLMLIPDAIPFLIAPLHYLYAKHLIYSSRKFQKKDWLHFLPFILYELYIIPDFFKPAEEILAALQNIEIEGLSLGNMIFNWAIIIQGFTYMFLTLAILKRYSRYIKDIFSTIEKIKMDWLRNITYMVLIVLLIFLIENMLLLGGINLSNYFNLTSLLAAIYVYTLGYLGLLKSEIFTASEIVESISHFPHFNRQSSVKSQQDNQRKEKKYEKSGLSSNMAKVYLEDLLNLMKEEKPYTNSNLTLNKLAVLLSISPHNLSEVINTQLNQNFFDFVNQYRVDKVKSDLADPQKQNFTLLAIALDAGFNSKSSFNAIFKKHTGMTPSEYRKTLLTVSS